MLLSDVTPTPDPTCADIRESALFVDAGWIQVYENNKKRKQKRKKVPSFNDAIY